MKDFNAVVLFVKVVQAGSFSEAARREGVPVSTISRKVRELEDHLGIQLLRRSTRKQRLTELGQAYYEHCQRGLEAFEAADLILQNRVADLCGTLRLSAPPNLSDLLVAPLVRGFRKIHPNVRFKVLVTERHVDLIEDRIDLALRVGALKDSTLHARTLLRYRHVLVASPSYLEQVGTPTHPADLTEHRTIAFAGQYRPVIWTLSNGSHTEDVAVEPVLAMNDYSGIEQAALDGEGIAEMPSIVAHRALESGCLIPALAGWHFAPTTLSAVYSGNRALSPLVRLFKSYCADHIDSIIGTA